MGTVWDWNDDVSGGSNTGHVFSFHVARIHSPPTYILYNIMGKFTRIRGQSALVLNLKTTLDLSRKQPQK
jgi:hypothetical protein